MPSGKPSRKQYDLDEIKRAVLDEYRLAPLVCACRKTGEGDEVRPPGLYVDGRGVPTIVYAGDGPTDADLARYFPAAESPPLLVGGDARADLL